MKPMLAAKNRMRMIRRLIREPFVHFLFIGASLFAAYAWLNPVEDEFRVLRVTSAEADWIKEMWARQRQREPSEDELKGLLRSYLKERILAAEAKQMSLDENDTIVRRRLAQKLEFLLEDTARLTEPTEDQLRDFLAANSDRYQTPARVSFTQIYFKTEIAARGALTQLSSHEAFELGERILLEREYILAEEQTVANLFGRQFAETVFALEPNRWNGPVKSGYGFHLVHLTERQPPRALAFEEIRGQLLDAWHRSEQAKAMDRFVAQLLAKYHLVVDESIQPLVGPLARAAK